MAPRVPTFSINTTFLHLLVYILYFTPISLTAFGPNSDPNSWCASPQCTSPPEPIKNAIPGVTAATARNGAPLNAVCGDKKCDVVAGENCKSCPGDCGPCKAGGTLVKGCVKSDSIALTFDDGPSLFTRQLINDANELKVPLTFFVNAMKVVQKPVLADTIKFAYDSGHTIASHTYSHRGLAAGINSDGTPNPDKFMPMGLFMQEILWNEYLIQTYIGVRPLFLRPPFLDYNETMINMIEGMGYIPIGVNLDTKDYELIQRNPNAATVGQQIIASFKNQFAIAKQQNLGFITLQHDIFNESINTFREIVTWLRTQNVKLVSIAECVGSPDQYRPKDPNVNIALASPANSAKSLHNLNANIGLSVLCTLALKFLV